MKKFAIIICTIFVVVALLFSVFFSTRIIKADNNVLASNHYFKMLETSEGDVSTAFLNSEIGIAPNGKAYNHTAIFNVFNAYSNEIHFNVNVYYNVVGDVSIGQDLTEFIVYYECGYMGGFGYYFALDGFVGQMVYTEVVGNINVVALLDGSYFLFELNSTNVINLFTKTSEKLENYKPNLDGFSDGYEVGDISLLIADIFYFYPEWIILHISLPLKAFGGVFNW